MIVLLVVIAVISYLAYELLYLYVNDIESIKVEDVDLLEALGEEIMYDTPRHLYYPLSEQFDIILTSGIYATVYKRPYSLLFPYRLSKDIGAVPVWWKSYRKIKAFHDRMLNSNPTGKTSSRQKLGL